MLTKKPINQYPLTKMINSTLVDLPTPSSISFHWNFGSLLGITLTIQIMTGLFLSFTYTPESVLAFSSTMLMTRDIQNMWMFRWLHSNGASLFFILIYLHIGRNLYYNTQKNSMVWTSGVIILFLLMGTAFLGYVLPWGQMSFWGATVITNLISALPYIGSDMVNWLWGGFSVNNMTLKRFFSLHFLFPLIITILVIIHLVFLHQTGSSNPSNLKSNMDSTQFHLFFITKDSLGIMITLTLYITLSLHTPLIFNDPDNFTESNPMVTPIHIQPEWYFLFAYAILRSIPNKLGGVLALLMSILILLLPLILKKKSIMTTKFHPLNKMTFWLFLSSFIILTWIGANPVEDPFLSIGQMFSLIYFILFSMMIK